MTCERDTNHDGDCHLCAKHGGCESYQAMRAEAIERMKAMTTKETRTIPLELLERAIETAELWCRELRSDGCAGDFEVKEAKQLIADLEAVKAAEEPPMESGTAWRVPLCNTHFGIALNTGLSGLILLICRGPGGWQAMSGRFAFTKFPGQLYVEELRGEIANDVLEVCAVDLKSGQWKTIYAHRDSDVTHK